MRLGPCKRRKERERFVALFAFPAADGDFCRFRTNAPAQAPAISDDAVFSAAVGAGLWQLVIAAFNPPPLGVAGYVVEIESHKHHISDVFLG